jgi:hypothetical protein
LMTSSNCGGELNNQLEYLGRSRNGTYYVATRTHMAC